MVATGIRPVRAVLFDLDGTLVDTEIHTDEAIKVVVARHGIADFVLPHTETRGRTWTHVADAIRERTNIGAQAADLAAELLAYWTNATASVTPVPGASDAVRAAARRMRVGVVSSSPRIVIDSFLEQLAVSQCVDPRARIGADDVDHGKPDAQGFLLAARVLDVDPSEVLVFEDSRAGLLAAKAAGMRSVFITCCASDIPANARLAMASCADYRALPTGFWQGIADGSLDLAGRSFT